LETIATVTPEERQALWELARAFDEMPTKDADEPEGFDPPPAGEGIRPGDDFNARASWSEILEPHGWALVYRRGGTEYWRRPGKDRGHSATVNGPGANPGRFVCFSSSTPFETKKGYTKFAVYAILNHGGHFQAAARELRARGFGTGRSNDRSGKAPAQEPASRSESLPPPAPFPSDVFPEPIRPLVVDGAAAVGAPEDFLGNAVLGIAAGIIGNTQRIELKTGYEQRAILWTAVVGDSGTVKTPAINTVRSPMEELQKEATKSYDDAAASYLKDLVKWEMGDKATRGEKPEPPKMRHYYVSDATLEAIQAVHAHEPGLVLIRDELLGWVKSHDAYRGGKGGDRQNWLQAWAGVPIEINRKTGPVLYIPEPAISVLGGVQPEMLSELAEEAGRRDGFLDRILWAYPAALPALWSEKVLESEITQRVKKVFATLRGNSQAANPIRLSPEAKTRWVEWHDENVKATQCVYGLAQGICAKLPNQLARLCLVLHCLTYPNAPWTEEVSEKTMADAIELVEYFRSHAHRVLPLIGSAAEQQAVALKARILRALNRDPGAWVNQSAIAAIPGGHVPATELLNALQVLETLEAVESTRRSA
jgi:hypothetical protein